MKNEVIKNYQKLYNKQPEAYLQSGGRFELLGNHTDHNHGKTLAATCSLMIEGAFSKEENNIVKLCSKGQCQFEIDITDTEPREETVDRSACFIRGIADYLKKHGYKVGGFSIYTESLVPPGAGVSSSAAFEILLGKVFNKLYNDNKISILDLCKAGQYAENNYFGKKSGLLDQIACASLGISYIDFGNIEQPKIDIIHNDFDQYQFVITDTGKSHAGLSDLYSSIFDDMFSAAKKMGHKFLRECSLEQLEGNSEIFTEGEYNRAKHFFEENIRVEKGLNCLKNNDFAGFFECVNQSSLSSKNLLKNAMVRGKYKGSLAEAIDISNAAMDHEGASKINGGGFGGSIISIVPLVKLDKYLKVMKNKYGEDHVFCVSILNKVEE
jgi:galactokinase